MKHQLRIRDTLHFWKELRDVSTILTLESFTALGCIRSQLTNKASFSLEKHWGQIISWKCWVSADKVNSIASMQQQTETEP